MVDTEERGLVLDPQPASVQDRDGAVQVLRLSRRSVPFVAKVFADMCFSGDTPRSAIRIDDEIVPKPPDQAGFAFIQDLGWSSASSWISRNRRLWKDPEATIAATTAILYAASVMILVRHPRPITRTSRTDSAGASCLLEIG